MRVEELLLHLAYTAAPTAPRPASSSLAPLRCHSPGRSGTGRAGAGSSHQARSSSRRAAWPWELLSPHWSSSLDPSPSIPFSTTAPPGRPGWPALPCEPTTPTRGPTRSPGAARCSSIPGRTRRGLWRLLRLNRYRLRRRSAHVRRADHRRQELCRLQPGDVRVAHRPEIHPGPDHRDPGRHQPHRGTRPQRRIRPGRHRAPPSRRTGLDRLRLRHSDCPAKLRWHGVITGSAATGWMSEPLSKTSGPGTGCSPAGLGLRPRAGRLMAGPGGRRSAPALLRTNSRAKRRHRPRLRAGRLAGGLLDRPVVRAPTPGAACGGFYLYLYTTGSVTLARGNEGDVVATGHLRASSV